MKKSVENLDRLKGLSLHSDPDTAAGFVGDEGSRGVRGMTYSGESLKPSDNNLDNWYNPLLESTVRQITQEVEQMRAAGTLRPFTEGEPIGACPRRVKPKPVTDAQSRKYHIMVMEERREEMLKLRARNDETIHSLLRSR